MCQDNESISVSGCSDLKPGPDHGWNPSESLILPDELVLVYKKQGRGLRAMRRSDQRCKIRSQSVTPISPYLPRLLMMYRIHPHSVTSAKDTQNTPTQELARSTPMKGYFSLESFHKHLKGCT